MTMRPSDSTKGYGTISHIASPLQSDVDCESTCADRGSDRELLAKVNSEYPTLSFQQTSAILLSLTGVTFSTSVSTGLLTVGLPVIARDLQLPEHLLLWPSSAYSLACGCLLLLAGSIADKIGDKLIFLLGSAILAASVLANGLVRDGWQLIAFRVLQGTGVSMCLPTGVSIITRSIPPGRTRNFAFSCIGLAQPVGFSLGLVAEGAIESMGNWRLGYYLCAASIGAFFALGGYFLPEKVGKGEEASPWLSIAKDIDWVGVGISSTALGLISHTCAVLSEDTKLLWEVENMAAIAFALMLLAAFPWWMQRQEHLGRPALVPNSIWKNRAFVSISVTVLLAWASLQSSELLVSLFFQKIQQISPIETSFRLLPSVVSGLILNPLTGLFVQNSRFHRLLACTSLVATVSPLIMTIIDPAWPWWIAAFWAVALGPVSIDVLFTVAHMVITDVFPSDMHALAGAIFNTVAQLGTSLGMSTMAIISSSVTRSSKFADKESPEALMAGYRAAFGLCFILMLLSAGTSLGLRCMKKPEER